ncbi:energy-coupling factor ABC transporter permease [Hyphomicrobium sp.]|uniref:energy-coupling factor ABC transporter permease n=1 Tax=Hyphomicrobium sp. TaxID=82 RepID=UPI000F9B047B|nr:energy-coupling factor ABC transporter permease [Hyphomicrobium sp.]RUO97757.1 MAG: cobalt transporter [Hyphomicrobium sp.]
MHIEPGLVTAPKIFFSYATAAAASAYALKLTWDAIGEKGLASVVTRCVITTALVFCFFEVGPHYPVGISEVHFIFGSTLFLIFGAGPAAVGLALGLLCQGLFFEPQDLPQFGMNVTTLLVPLLGLSALAKLIIAANTPYVDLKYRQAFALSTAYQGGIVAWVAFWALYGRGFGAENIHEIAAFGGAYMLVVLVEPLADLAVLAVAKTLRGMSNSGLFTPRLHNPEAT